MTIEIDYVLRYPTNTSNFLYHFKSLPIWWWGMVMVMVMVGSSCRAERDGDGSAAKMIE